MVFFNCNACGESMKKNQVDNHCRKCRNCQVVSCVDCGKEFWGNDYNEHVKCISEQEKYSGKNYKPTVNKGEVKQSAWIDQCQRAIDKHKNDIQLKDLLIRLQSYPNIPRKKAKFLNFARSSLNLKFKEYLVGKLWEVLEAEANIDKQKAEAEKAEKGVEPEKTTTVTQTPEETRVEAPTENDENTTKKKNKREKKEERSGKKASKKEKKNSDQHDQAEENGEKKTKKKRKRKHDSESEENEGVTTEAKRVKRDDTDAEQKPVENGKHKEKKKNKTSQLDTSIAPNTNHDHPVEPDTGDKCSKKFNWLKTIVSLLEHKSDKEMGINKLKKKVIAEYMEKGGKRTKSEHELWAKFSHKINAHPRFKVLKERVKLVDEG
ncbi:cell growth-regulating nucleolar protein-like [Tubulanus polymorphus]|uniref:cell growth-regulating nucleolar protein-like n=1 Tax=Tubulanus polymorphus TaxID=672921 RepID=UPI003DA51851